MPYTIAPLSGEFAWRTVDGHHAGPAVALGWDGRIDNCGDLMPHVAHLLRGRTDDGALVAAAYERWGIAGLGRVIGDWSVAKKSVMSGSDSTRSRRSG